MFWVNVKGVSQWYEIGSKCIKSMGGPHECPYKTNCADAVRHVGICHRHSNEDTLSCHNSQRQEPMRNGDAGREPRRSEM